ncbi:MAG: Hpt domain-containing protein [Deltaproteobacteria bacterium]|nr:Hpt domain-containing protein [Deltaproteobacteria bacterium]
MVSDSTKEAPIDLTKAVQRAMGDSSFLETMLEKFLEGMPAQVEALKTAIEKGDSDGLRETAHSLKGAAANLSADRLAQAAFRLEQMGRENDLGDAQEALGILMNNVTQLAAFVKDTDWSSI